MAARTSLGTSTLKPSSTSTSTTAPGRRKSRSRHASGSRKRVSMELPERFQVSDDDEDDASTMRQDAFPAQSVYGLIAQAQKSRPDLTARLSTRGQSQSESESEAEGDDEQLQLQQSKRKGREDSRTGSSESSRRTSLEEKKDKGEAPSSKGHKKRMSESKLLRSFLKPIRERSDSQGQQDAMSQSQFLPPKEKVVEEEERMSASTADIRSDAPVMDQKLKAKARADLESSTTSQGIRKSREGTPTEGHRRAKTAVSLPQALAEIFQLAEPEEIIAEYPCWYLQSVLLQGYMYITQQHLCFYAYLQKKGNVLMKSGHLSKQGKRSPRYRRHYFQLKGDVLSYYASAADPYFPNGSIDLRYGISAELATDGKDKQSAKETTDFTIVTDTRTYYLRADSPSSAREWVRQLQKVIFRSHNEGDSVKICVPLDNVIDVESNPVIEFADTMRLRVLDGTTTFAVDEYFFTFFNHGNDAINLLQFMTQDNGAKKTAEELENEELPGQKKVSPFRRSMSAERSLSRSDAPPLSEHVRSTLSPLSGGPQASPRLSTERGRSSGEVSRTSFDRSRTSFDRGRRSASGTSRTSSQWRRMSKSPLSPSAQESSESFITTSEHPSSPATIDGKDDMMSASQMLTGDGYFNAPTLRHPQPRRTVSGSTVERLKNESREQSPQSLASGRIQVEPPTPMSRADTNPLSTSPEEISRRDGRGQVPQPTEVPTTGRSMRAIATPLQHAFTLAGVVRSHGKRMSSYLSSSPKSYYDKFSGAIAGGQRHYSENDALAAEDGVPDLEDNLDVAEHERRFQQHFALPETERLRAVFYCWLHRVLPLYGKIYISDRRFCFRSLLYGTRTKLVVPFRDIDNCGKEKGFRWGYPGMVLIIRGHEELFFDFGTHGVRDDCVVTVLKSLDNTKAALESVIFTREEKEEAENAAAEHELLQDALKKRHALEDREILMDEEKLSSAPPVLFDDLSASVLDLRPKKPMRITCLTIGSRGDVQPYIALCKRFIAHGHHAKIATHAQFEGWVRKHGVDFEAVEGDPAELMRLCVESGMFTPSFVMEANSKFRGWLDELLQSSWKACQNSDLLIESPSAMGGIHIAEALAIPYFRAFTMPWTRTRAYPHAFAVPNTKRGGQYNILSYTLMDSLFWGLTSGQINKFRRKTLGLPATDLFKLQINKVPFLYNFSPNVVVPPLDFSDWIRVTGYWFLDEADGWEPPQDLVDFIDQARKDEMKLVYIGFGSVPVSDTKFLTAQIVDAVLKADVRCILSKGWSDHFDQKKKKKDGTTDSEDAFPPSIFPIRSAPHDWLFNRIDAAVHHGGAGTTGASLRAGLPTVIKPFFGDQFFFATRVEDLGVGIHLKKISVNALGKAIWRATHDERMRTKATGLGELIRAEDGVGVAVNAVYRDLEYARTLIKKAPEERQKAGEEGDGEWEGEEQWTFIEDLIDVDVTAGRRVGREEEMFPLAAGKRESVDAGGSGGPGGGRREVSLGSMALRGRGS